MERIKRRHHGICGVPTWVTLECTLVTLIFLSHTVGVYGNSDSPVILTATDAYPVFGGYVVPVNGSITLHCEAQGPDYDNYTGLQWNIAMGAYSWARADIAVIALRSERFTALSIVNNPAKLHAHNLLQSENGSTVQCLISNHPPAKWSQIVTIYVEDIPNCVEHLNTLFSNDLFIVSWNSYDGLLPVVYNISIWSTSNEEIMSKSTVQPMLRLNESAYSLRSNTTYFVLVTTCNSFGCSQDCSNNTIEPVDLHVTVHDSLPTKVGRNSSSLSVWTLVIIVVPVAVALFTIILIMVILLFCCIGSCQMCKTRDVVQKSATQQNDHEHMSEREVQETGGVSHTSIDVTGVVMEENPAYGMVPIKMGDTDIAELPPPLPLRPQDTVNIDMQENPSYSPLQTNSGVQVTVTK